MKWWQFITSICVCFSNHLSRFSNSLKWMNKLSIFKKHILKKLCVIKLHQTRRQQRTGNRNIRVFPQVRSLNVCVVFLTYSLFLCMGSDRLIWRMGRMWFPLNCVHRGAAVRRVCYISERQVNITVRKRVNNTVEQSSYGSWVSVKKTVFSVRNSPG